MIERRTVVTVLLVSTLLTVLGVGGMASNVASMSNAPVPEVETLIKERPPESLSDAIMFQLTEAHLSNPYRRPIAAMGVIVSAMVLIGSFMLTWRAKAAQWWIKQAVIAKCLWIVVSTLVVASHVKASVDKPLAQLVPFLEEGYGELDWGGNLTFALIAAGLFNMALHCAAGWRATRPDVAAFIESKPR